ncbi:MULTISPECIES: lysylphosphatidylglycerol synthase domain-containing protein [unclassified Streptosporangium]|uniref:lysylphosphatidylglycerol synthase domain-containing protein n=1 Tax=Streptosporangium sp. NPDC005286 TaxID=3154463 RepID=UPI0033B86FD3
MLSRLRSSRLLRVLLALVAVGFLGYGLARNRDETVAAISQLSWWSLAGSYLSVMAGIGLMVLAWRALLAGMGSPLPLGITARIFFIGQLGKYVPGSVWAYAAMIELGRDHRVPPRRMFGSITLSVLVSLGCALVVAAVTLRETMTQAWYLLALIPVIAVCLHPGVLTFGLNLAMRIARQEPLGQGRLLSGRAVLTAVALTVAGWLTYGPHLLLPMADLGASGDSLYLVATGAYALAWATGILTVVVPAGIGVREGAMVLALAPVLDSPRALVAAVVSRVMFTLADVSWAGIGFLWGRAFGPAGEPGRQAGPEPVATREGTA